MIHTDFGDVPETDDDAILIFDRYSDPVNRECLKGLFECRRKLGGSIGVAYEFALRTFIHCFDSTKRLSFTKGTAAN